MNSFFGFCDCYLNSVVFVSKNLPSCLFMLSQKADDRKDEKVVSIVLA